MHGKQACVSLGVQSFVGKEAGTFCMIFKMNSMLVTIHDRVNKVYVFHTSVFLCKV